MDVNTRLGMLVSSETISEDVASVMRKIVHRLDNNWRISLSEGNGGCIVTHLAMALMRSEKPVKLVEDAVKRMMGRRTAVALANTRMRKLHVYAGAEHLHTAQQPTVIDFGGLNRKNKRGE